MFESRRYVVALVLGIAAWAAMAAGPGEISQVQITSIAGSKSPTAGYFTITTASPVAGCEAGFWLPVSDPNYLSMFARAMDAFGSNVPVTVTADSSTFGPDPADLYCRIIELL